MKEKEATETQHLCLRRTNKDGDNGSDGEYLTASTGREDSKLKWFLEISSSSGTLRTGYYKWEKGLFISKRNGEKDEEKVEKCCFALRPVPPSAHDSLQMKCHAGRQ